MKAYLIALVMFIAAAASAESTNFKDWKNKQEKNSSETQESGGSSTSSKTLEEIEKHNSDPNATYKQGINDVPEVTEEERSAVRASLNADDKNVKLASFSKRVRGSLPESVSYLSLMSPVKAQGKCGSCWAFATVAVLEYWSRYNKTNKVFSEQNLVDCAKPNGCSGAQISVAFDYVIQQGISDGMKYTYNATNQTCQRKKFPKIYTLGSFCGGSIAGDDNILKSVVANYGPVVAIIETVPAFGKYKSGVFTTTECSGLPKDGNHAVTIVGYGVDPKFGKFWHVRNSWGTKWGDNGYFKIARGSNMCGIANKAFGVCSE